MEHTLSGSNLTGRNTPGYRGCFDQHFPYRCACRTEEVLPCRTNTHTAARHLHTNGVRQIQHETVNGWNHCIGEVHALKEIATSERHICVLSVSRCFFKAHQIPVRIKLFRQHLSQCCLCALAHL